MKTLDTVSLFIKQNNLIAPGDRIVCGLSGGADSCTMVSLLHRLSHQLGFSIVCAHLHHGLRGKEADRDLLFSKSFAQKLNLPFFSKTVDIPLIAKEKGLSEEDAGRQERYAFFREVMAETKGNKIATAHNKDDNAETILMHIVRSSGIKGICGIPPKREEIIRPLLCVSRKDIEEYCSESGICYVTDSTNAVADYTRNKFRLEIIPALEEINPSVKDALCRLGASATLHQDFVETLAEKIPVEFTENGAEVSADYLIKLHPALVPEFFRRVLKEIAPEFQLSVNSVTAFLSLLEKKSTTGRVLLENGITARRSYDKIIISANKSPSPFEYALEVGRDICIHHKKIHITDTLPEKGTVIPWDGITSVTVRSRRPGDKMKIRGMSRKLQDMFVNLKIDRVVRDKLLVITFDESVVWAEQIGFDDSIKNTKATKYIVITSEEHL